MNHTSLIDAVIVNATLNEYTVSPIAKNSIKKTPLGPLFTYVQGIFVNR